MGAAQPNARRTALLAGELRREPVLRGFGGTFQRAWLIWIGIVALGVPTVIHLAQGPWATDQGSYGLIVMALAIWLVARRWPAMRAVGAPGNAILGYAALGGAVLAHVFARIILLTPLEAISFYCALVATLYLIVGARGLREAAFPLVYALLAVPPPGSLIASLTTGLRLANTTGAVDLLNGFGLPVAREGLVLFVDQYKIAVVEACSGINSIISLTAIGFFYVYARGRPMTPVIAAASWAVVLVMAIVGNFARVLTIILLTHFFGDGAAQGPLHEVSGFVTFAVALGGIVLVDYLVPDRLPAHG